MTKEESAKEKIEVTQEFLDGVEQVFCAVTGNQVSKLNTDPKHVIAMFEELFTDKQILLDDILEMADNATFKGQFKKELKSYLS